MQRGEEGGVLAGEDGERMKIDVEVEDVEVGGGAADEFDHAGVRCVVDLEVAGEAGGGVADGDELGGGAAVARGEEGDVMAHGDEGFGEPVDDAFGAAVPQGGDGFEERGDLRNTHQKLNSGDRVFSCTANVAPSCRVGD